MGNIDAQFGTEMKKSTKTFQRSMGLIQTERLEKRPGRLCLALWVIKRTELKFSHFCEKCQL